jgi:hypothetical protein
MRFGHDASLVMAGLALIGDRSPASNGRIVAIRLPFGLPLSVRRNTDDSVGNTIRHDDEGDAAGELRARVG